MAENIPTIPTGAVPPKKETGKVQPRRKRCASISAEALSRPDDQAAELPPGGPTGGPSRLGRRQLAPLPPRSRRARARHGRRPAAPRSAPSAPRSAAPAPMAMRPATSLVDTILAVVAAIVGLAAIGSAVYLCSFCRTSERGRHCFDFTLVGARQIRRGRRVQSWFDSIPI